MILLKKYWKKLFKNHIKINFDYLFNVVFYTGLFILGVFSIQYLITTSEEDIILDLEESLSKSTGRRLRNDLLYLKIFKIIGKEGFFLIVSIIIYVITMHYLLPNLRKFLGKEVEKEEEKEEENKE